MRVENSGSPLDLPVIQPGQRIEAAPPIFQKVGIVGLGLIGGSVALAARQMHGAGTPLADIRRAIDLKYKSEYPTSTPTPHPH